MTEAHVLWLRDPLEEPLQQLQRYLSPGERDELATLRHPLRARSFILSRTLLRHLINTLLPGEPVLLERETTGRLVLRNRQGWHISVSHCPAHVAVMLASAPCGIDIETRRDINWRGIAQRYFAPDEQNFLLTLPDKQGRQAFLDLWTLKEAGVKALGKGLANHLSTLSFDIRIKGQPVACRDDMAVYQQHTDALTLAMSLMTKEKASWQVHQLAFSSLQ